MQIQPILGFTFVQEREMNFGFAHCLTSSNDFGRDENMNHKWPPLNGCY